MHSANRVFDAADSTARVQCGGQLCCRSRGRCRQSSHPPKLEITDTVYLNTRYSCIVLKRRHNLPMQPQSEAARIADQLPPALESQGWHGGSVFEILEG